MPLQLFEIYIHRYIVRTELCMLMHIFFGKYIHAFMQFASITVFFCSKSKLLQSMLFSCNLVSARLHFYDCLLVELMVAWLVIENEMELDT